MKKTLHLKTCFLLLFLAVLLYLAAAAVMICRYGQKDDKEKSDIAIILGAATWENEVSPVFRERINHGIQLYREGYVDKILLTGGKAKDNAHSDAYVAMQYVLLQGIPREDILLEEESTITRENLDNAIAIMEKAGFHSAIIVSDPLHMKRAMLMVEEQTMTFHSSPTPTTMYRSLKTQLPFLVREVVLYTGYQLYYFLLR